MVRGSQRSTRFTGSSLIRLLAHLADADAPASPPPAPSQQPAFAQRLSQWLEWTDAVALSGALKAPAGPASAAASSAPRHAGPAAESAAGDLARVRAALAKAITEDASTSPAPPWASARRAGAAATTTAPAADFAPHRQRYLAHQHRMHTRIAPLRARLREALACSASPALARLAAVDAVMEQALDTHEQTLLARIPALLERRFQRLRAAHAGHDTPDDPRQPEPAWLTTFTHDLHAVLLAELDLRLQPAEGLLDALRTPPTTTT